MAIGADGVEALPKGVTPVFLSVGRTATKEQEEFVNQFEGRLRLAGLKPETVGRTKFSVRAPLHEIRELMLECKGVAVIAFERMEAPAAVEFRGGIDEREHHNVRWPSVWNQIEAAIGYTLNKPLLVIVEKGMRPEGLLEGRYDWYVAEVSLKSDWFETAEFSGIFDDWRTRVQSSGTTRVGNGARRDGLGDISIGELALNMPARQVWGVVSVIAGLIGVVGTLAFKLGQSGLWP